MPLNIVGYLLIKGSPEIASSIIELSINRFPCELTKTNG